MTDNSVGAARPDLWAGGAFVTLGGAFALGALQYDIGTAFRMGPGYVPLTLGCLLAGLGAIVLAQGGLLALGRRAVDQESPEPAERPGPVPWRRGALLVAAVVAFGLTVDKLGIGLATFVTTFLAALSGHRNTPLRALVLAAGLTVLCLVVFVGVLQLRLPLLGTWFGG
ncbi:MAG: tripartite tricarboxylate transporter TctB family protein [Nocardioides sp.]